MKTTGLRLLILVSLLGLGACAGGKGLRDGSTESSLAAKPAAPRGLPIVPAPAGLVLPPVSSLSPGPPRHSSFTEADLMRDGSEFEAALGSNRVVANGTDAVFSPASSESSTGLDDVAFAIYRFDIQDYDREHDLHFIWEPAPVGITNYMGLPNFTNDHWDFIFSPADDTGLVDFAPYTLADGSFFIALILLGNGDATLHHIRIGDVYPTAVLETSATTGELPFGVDFDAGLSSTPEGSITQYDWDYDGDGLYDDINAPSSVQHNYPLAGTFEATVQVTNEAGHTDTESTTITVTEPGPPADWVHTLGKTDMEQFFGVAADSQGNFYAVGQTDDPTRMMLVSKWSNSGNLLWAKTYNFPDGISIAFDVGVDTQDNAVVGGFGYMGPSDNFDAIVQKYDPNGNLLWSKAYGASSLQFVYTLCMDGDDIYCAGQTEGKDNLTFRVNPDGSLNWARQYREENYRPWDCAMLDEGSGNSALYVLVSSEHFPVTDPYQPLLLRYGLDGSLQADDLMNTGTDSFDPRGLAVSYDQQSSLATIYLCGNYNLNEPQNFCLAAVQSDRTPVYEMIFTNIAGSHAFDMLYDSNSLIAVGNYVDELSGDQYAAVWTLVASDGFLNALDCWSDPSGSATFEEIIPGQPGLMYCGTGSLAGGTWTSANTIAASASHTWADNDGANFPVISFPVEDTAGTLADWSGYTLDDGAGSTDGLLVREL